ncbi:MAG: hypothetical protein F4218_00695 [Synechococcus sp. SB0677_bin_5]|nr:hypothetical protein [Synechococcus sp. SB0677_bin_5]
MSCNHGLLMGKGTVVGARDGELVNGLGKVVEVEDAYLFPMLKSSDVAKEQRCANRMMIVPQQGIAEDTSHIQRDAPRTWGLLLRPRRAA